jgi:hypothetical protein
VKQPSRSAALARATGLRAARASVLGLSLGVSTGCYTSRALMGAPDPGTLTVVTLNDRGRVLLGDALGQSADRVEGSVVSRDDSAFVVAVRNVRYFSGQSNEWSGERVTVPLAGVRGLEERRYSRARTWLLVGAATAGLVALILTRSLLGKDPTIVELPGGPPPQGS